jgi:hypothetical protein
MAVPPAEVVVTRPVMIRSERGQVAPDWSWGPKGRARMCGWLAPGEPSVNAAPDPEITVRLTAYIAPGFEPIQPWDHVQTGDGLTYQVADQPDRWPMPDGQFAQVVRLVESHEPSEEY